MLLKKLFYCFFFVLLTKQALGSRTKLATLQVINYSKDSYDTPDKKVSANLFLPVAILDDESRAFKFYATFATKFSLSDRSHERYLPNDMLSLGGVFAYSLDQAHNHSIIFYPILNTDSSFDYLYHDLNLAYKTKLEITPFLKFEGGGLRLRNIKGVKNFRYNYQIDFAGSFFDDKLHYFIYIPSEMSLFYMEKNYYLGAGLVFSSLNNKVKDKNAILKDVGYRALPFISFAHKAYGDYWLEASLGAFGFEKIEHRYDQNSNKVASDKSRDIPFSMALSLVHKS
jgi:hypothetical protein